MAIFEKMADLTPQIYLIYKRQEMTDTEIGRLYDVSLDAIRAWKHKHGLIGKINIHQWETWDKYFPKEVKKLKKRFMELYNQGWKHVYICEELNMSRAQLTRFKDRYFPDLMKRVQHRLTDEQKAIAKSNGLKINTVLMRIKEQGITAEEAIRKPLEKEGWRGDPAKRMIGKKKASEVDQPVKIRIRDHLTDEEIEKATSKGISRNVLYRRIKAGWNKKAIINKKSRKKRGKKK